jgi:hypothetical protein
MAALRLDTTYPFWSKRLEAVFALGGSRCGNENWKSWYNTRLGSITIRLVNYRDVVPKMIKHTIRRGGSLTDQLCLKPGEYSVGYRHVGDAVLMCPSSKYPGLQEFRVYPAGLDVSAGQRGF